MVYNDNNNNKNNDDGNNNDREIEIKYDSTRRNKFDGA